MSTLGWVALIILAAALGFGLGLLRSRSSGKVAQMQGERDAARQELGEYRREVDAHFERTAQLFDKVTDDYRNLYDHLALGARQLGAIPGESSEASLARPEQRRLAAEEGGVAPAADDGESAAENAAETEAASAAGPDEATNDEQAHEEPAPAESAPEPSSEEKARHAGEKAPSEDHDKADADDEADKGDTDKGDTDKKP